MVFFLVSQLSRFSLLSQGFLSSSGLGQCVCVSACVDANGLSQPGDSISYVNQRWQSQTWLYISYQPTANTGCLVSRLLLAGREMLKEHRVFQCLLELNQDKNSYIQQGCIESWYVFPYLRSSMLRKPTLKMLKQARRLPVVPQREPQAPNLCSSLLLLSL